MQKWEYTYLFQSIAKVKMINPYVTPANIWSTKGEDGKSASDDIEKLGSNGWELVSVTPIADSTGGTSPATYTKFLFFTFKRPIKE